LEELQRAVMSDPDLAEAHYNLGLALAQSAHVDEAVHELNEAISLEPKYTDARIQLGLVLSQKNDTAGAANVFREVVRRDPNVAKAPDLNTKTNSETWSHAAYTWIEKDCTQQIDYPKLKTEVRGFWTDSDLYLLFISPYNHLNLWLPADNSKDRLKLWDRDVVEFFLGDDWTDIKHYREFEIAPTGDWVDLAIDLNKDSYDANWNSGWQRQGRIDEKNHVWYAATRVPLKSVSEEPIKAGTKWRAN